MNRPPVRKPDPLAPDMMSWAIAHVRRKVPECMANRLNGSIRVEFGLVDGKINVAKSTATAGPPETESTREELATGAVKYAVETITHMMPQLMKRRFFGALVIVLDYGGELTPSAEISETVKPPGGWKN